MSKHTKGPWSVGGPNKFLNQLTIEPSIGVAYGAGEELYANANLMAAAPDMFAALDRLARLGNGFEYGNSEGNLIAQAAILKALKGGGE